MLTTGPGLEVARRTPDECMHGVGAGGRGLASVSKEGGPRVSGLSAEQSTYNVTGSETAQFHSESKALMCYFRKTIQLLLHTLVPGSHQVPLCR